MEEKQDKKQDREEITENLIKIGDLLVSSNKASLNDCSDLSIKLLKNKTVKEYLDVNYTKKKLSGLG